MRKEIKFVTPTTIDQVLHRYLAEECCHTLGIGTYSFGVDGQCFHIYRNDRGDLVVNLGQLYHDITLKSFHVLELIEAKLHKAGLLPKDNTVVVKARIIGKKTTYYHKYKSECSEPVSQEEGNQKVHPECSNCGYYRGKGYPYYKCYVKGWCPCYGMVQEDD